MAWLVAKARDQTTRGLVWCVVGVSRLEAWRQTMAPPLGLKSHVETDTASTNPEWCQLDDLIKMWILESLCDSLQEQFVTASGIAKALCGHLKNLLHDNKDARAINLDNELRFIKIRKMTVNEYCTKIQAMANRLKNLDCEVSEINMVIFAINGLDSRFATLAKIIRHREPLPTFKTVHNMLLLKESSFNDDSTSTTFESSSSSPTILMAFSSSNTIVIRRSLHMFAMLVSLAKQPPTSPSNIPSLIEPQHARTHSVATRSQSGIVKPIERLSLHTSSLSSIPKSPFIVLKDPNWCNVTYDEYNALVKNVYMHQSPGFVDSRYPNHQIVDSLNKEFDMTDLRALNYFIGISVVHHPTGLFLSQKKYVFQLLERAHMVNCNPSRTPVDTDSKLGSDGVPIQDPTLYRSLAGGLQYLTFTSPDLSYAVEQICLYMHDPRESHFAALKRIMRYVQGTLELGLHLYASATTSLVGVEAEYQGVANVVAETAWLHNLLRELHSPLLTALVYCDNINAVYISANPVQHQRTKHIEIDIHFVRGMVKAGHVRVLHVPSRFQYADIFTKGLPPALFENFSFSLSVRPPPVQTARAY
nr:ribonuclease H-like domain-containing protein [Tanacetum cinerariifolium]